MGLTGTLALCSTPARLRSSAAKPGVVSQMTYPSTVSGRQPGVAPRRCLWSAPGLIAEVDDERFELTVSTTDLDSFSQTCVRTTWGDWQNPAGSAPRGSSSVGLG